MIQNITFPVDTRVLIVSDVHGNLKLLKNLLKHLDYSESDILIVNGDIAEKGDQSIELFRYLFELEKTHQVYFTLGNCDHLINHFKDESKNDGMTRYMHSREKTLLAEIALKMGGNPSYIERKTYALEHLKDIVDKVSKLPIVLKTPYFTCVHAGLREDGEIDRPFNLSVPDFFRQDVSFDTPVIVGHYPVCLYSDDEINYNTRFDRKKNIISMDGGNNMKALGQLNVVIFENGQFTFDAIDDLETQIAPYAQTGQKGVHINWANNGIEIVEKGTLYSKVYHPYSNQTVSIYNAFLDFENQTLLQDTTTSLLTVEKGDLITIQYETPTAYYIKCKGYVGWYLKNL